jgi:PAS domain S-box-containing protein
MSEINLIAECPSEELCKSGAWTWNITENTFSVSNNWKKMLGYSVDEISILDNEWIEKLHPDDKFKTSKILNSLNKNIITHFDFYYRIKNKYGLYCWMNCYGSAINFDKENNATVIQGVQQDVDDLKVSEEYFREVNLRFSVLAENFGGGILLENQERKIFFINQQFCDFFNIPIPPEQLLGGDCSDAAENSKHLFEDPELFIINVNTALENKVPVYSEICKMKNGLILERDYVPIFENQQYKGHLWTYRDITRFKETEGNLSFRLHFEELITKLSANFINLAWKDIDIEIDKTLGLIGEFISADRSYVYLFCNDENLMSNKYEWSSDSAINSENIPRDIPINIYPCWIKKIKNQESIFIPSVKDMPEEAFAEKEILEPQGIVSLIAVPMIYSENVIGYIGFDAKTHFRAFTDDSIKLLTMAASVITNAIKRKENEEALSNSEAQYRIVVNSVKEVIFQTDINGNWIFLNPAWTDITDWGLEESLNKNFSNFIHLDQKQINLSLFNEAINGYKESFVCDTIFITKSGKQKICEVFVKTVLSDKKTILGTSGTIRDITLQRDSEQEIKKLNRAVETIPTGIMLFDFNGIISYVNPGLINLCAFNNNSQIIGQSIFALTSSPGKSVLKDAIKSHLSKGLNWMGELELRKANGKFFASEMICSVINDDNNTPQYIVSNFYDITERKEAEAEIKNSLIKEKELSELKTRFVSMVSHEFRTPLAAIQSSSDLIEMYWDKLEETKRGDLLSKIKTAIKNLMEILNDVTDINKVDSGKAKLNLEEINVVRLLDELIDEVKQGNPTRPKINYTHSIESLNLISDKKLLRQIFINLISNSIKYTKPQKNVYISLEQLPDIILFKVVDEGIGIPEESFDTLFEPFMRSNNIGKIKGTGLGLSILKRAIDLLGGRIDFESKVDVGSTFTVYLPDHFSTTTQEELNFEHTNL